ncbi:LCP family protein [Arthrobacter sp. NPDC089319]|uniref:LCP family protein n=1 Tax=Arthrobacter sp. NPDC089319 TaxID=3155915 RepID=UPI00341CFEF1
MNRLKKRPVLVTVSVLVGLLLVAGLTAGGYLWNLAHSFDSKSEKIADAFPEESTRPIKKAEGAVNILLMGSDTRGGDGTEDALEGAPGDARTDALMLLHVPSDRSGVYVMSIMRDTWTEIPGHGEHKINAAYALGGVPLTVQTVEGLFDTRIDHVAIIDFEGFRALTDALGGVEIKVNPAFTSSHLGGRHFAAGPTLMNGEEALAFVRERYAYSDGDYQRVRNQRAFVGAVLSKFLTADTLTNPARISATVDQFAPYITVDESLNAGAIGTLGLGLNKVRKDDIHMFTLPTKGTGSSRDGQSIVLKDEQAIKDITAALGDDSLDKYWQTLPSDN